MYDKDDKFIMKTLEEVCLLSVLLVFLLLSRTAFPGLSLQDL